MRKVLKGYLEQHNDNWNTKFKLEAEKIKNILGVRVKDIQHIGSTSIPGMVAKPIIDIGVLVDFISDKEFFIDKLMTLGYIYKPDMSSVERIFLRKGNPVEYHLSVACPFHTFWERNIIFRDYLRKHPDFVSEYNELKIKNLLVTPEEDYKDLSRSKIYNNGKGDFVQKVLRLANNG